MGAETMLWTSDATWVKDFRLPITGLAALVIFTCSTLTNCEPSLRRRRVLDPLHILVHPDNIANSRRVVAKAKGRRLRVPAAFSTRCAAMGETSTSLRRDFF